MNIGQILFGFRGRINRGKYWLAVLIIIVVSVAMALLSTVLDPNSIALQVLNVVVGIATIVVSLAIALKRLHDRNKSGWWLLLYYFFPGVLIGAAVVFGYMGLSDGSAGDSVISGALMIVAGLLYIWAFVELGCLRGTVGPNQYGPDPLAAQA
jgi:uncharacterized membrane protein YhaH (DUF805 family)